MIDWLGEHLLEILLVILLLAATTITLRWLYQRYRGASPKGSAQVSYSD